MKTETKDKPGKGHQARIAATIIASCEIDGQKTDFKFNYDVSVTVEQIEYAVKHIAGVVAKAASKVAGEKVTILSRPTADGTGEMHATFRGPGFQSGTDQS